MDQHKVEVLINSCTDKGGGREKFMECRIQSRVNRNPGKIERHREESCRSHESDRQSPSTGRYARREYKVTPVGTIYVLRLSAVCTQ